MSGQRQSTEASDEQASSAWGSGPLDTTEVRWFAAGRIPQSFVTAFRRLPGPVHREMRIDTYLAAGSIDRGVKRRDRGPIEVKSRLPYSGAVDFGEAVPGRIEEWRKAAAADGQPYLSDNEGSWVDVEKIILKRFEQRLPAGTGCQTELTSLLVAGTAAWTFALEAWGPAAIRRDLLRRAVREFSLDGSLRQEFEASLLDSMGYPEWLATVTGCNAG